MKTQIDIAAERKTLADAEELFNQLKNANQLRSRLASLKIELKNNKIRYPETVTTICICERTEYHGHRHRVDYTKLLDLNSSLLDKIQEHLEERKTEIKHHLIALGYAAEI